MAVVCLRPDTDYIIDDGVPKVQERTAALAREEFAEMKRMRSP